MKTVLFCQNAYAFGILEPVMQVLKDRNYRYLWFIRAKLLNEFPFEGEPFTTEMHEVLDFQSDAIYVPGNEVPHFLRGLKVQVFHGLAGEKKGHFRIRHYFDLYLTQGPFFTERFLRLREKYKDFEVIETGWPKLDCYAREKHVHEGAKQTLLSRYGCKKIILFAPTFSPSLTSAPHLINQFEELALEEDLLILVKFHDLMAREWIEAYEELASRSRNIVIEKERNIINYMLLADLLISDTSSVVYEFLLLDKPVLTFRSSSQDIRWDDRKDYRVLVSAVAENFNEDRFRKERKQITQEYHPYDDGLSAVRMVDAVENYIAEHGVPEKRNLKWLRRRKIYKLFGKLS